jgi:PRC-barrel domain
MQRKLTNQLLAAGAVVIGGLLSAGPVLAQVSQQPIPLVRVDVGKMASGYRASSIIDSSVVNEHNEKIGMIDDLIIEPSEKVPFAVLSCGGFLGVGERLVVVPFDSLKISEDKIELSGATKNALLAMPEFSYAKK